MIVSALQKGATNKSVGPAEDGRQIYFELNLKQKEIPQYKLCMNALHYAKVI